MKRLLLFAIPLAALANGPQIDLTPVTRTYFEDGGSFSRLTFDGGDSTHSLTLDHELTLTKLAAGVRITFTRIPDASFSILPSPIAADKPLKPENMELYSKAALAQVANGTLAEEVPAPHPINGWTTHRYIIRYQVNRYPLKMAVTFLTFPEGAQIMLVTRADEKTFDDAIARSDTLLRSWNTVSKKGQAPSGS